MKYDNLITYFDTLTKTNQTIETYGKIDFTNTYGCIRFTESPSMYGLLSLNHVIKIEPREYVEWRERQAKEGWTFE